jgi:hypothetical protein
VIVEESGFSNVSSVKLLGIKITNDIEQLVANFDPIITKITSLISYWSRFRLSLPGRITIAKTFLISQINYLGSIFLPSEDQLNNMQALINNFIRKNLQISEERLHLPVECGGLGFFNIKNFFAGSNEYMDFTC